VSLPLVLDNYKFHIYEAIVYFQSIFKIVYFPPFLGIFLSGFKLNAQDVDRRLNFIDENDGGLPLEIVISLKRFQPSTEETEMYKNYKGAKEELPKTDHFMIKVIRSDLYLCVMSW
jgi:hypothetical protein